MSECTLDSAGGQVEASELTAAIAGAVPRGWKKSFERTVRLAAGGHGH
jgi:hypothetical protein